MCVRAARGADGGAAAALGRGAKTVWAALRRGGAAAARGQPRRALEDDEKPFGGRRGVGRALLDAGARELGVSCWGAGRYLPKLHP